MVFIHFFQGIFLFALTWSLGGSTDRNGRDKFDLIVRELMMVRKLSKVK